MRRALVPLALALLAVLPARASDPWAARYDAMVPMSDGVRLDASLYVPPGDGPFPLIVRQHGGGSHKDNEYDTGYGLRALGRGFALLMYSHRGHGASEGSFDFFAYRTTRDFSEVLDWVETTPAAPVVDTANVGTSGYSQGGGESLLPAAFDARVRAVAVGNTFADLNHALNPDDCFKFSFATGIFLAAYKVSGSRTDDASAIRWGAQLYTDTEDVPAGGFPSTTDELRARSPQNYLGRLAERKVPVFWAQSWEDQLFPGDHPERILEPLEAAGAPVHYWFSSGGHAMGPDFPDDLEAKEAAILDWFDDHLRGVSHGFATGPQVDYWERVAPGMPGEWVHRTADDWPLATGDVRFWLNPGGRLGTDPVLSETPVGMIVNDLASANLANDAISNEIWRQTAGQAPGMGDALRSVPESPNPIDTATFTSAPLAAPLAVVGAPELRLSAESTAQRVFQVAAKVWDVGPAGASLVWRGCRSFLAAPDVEPELRLWPNAHTFGAGHRIVLTVSAVDFPTFKPDTEPQVTVIRSGSSLHLPVLG